MSSSYEQTKRKQQFLLDSLKRQEEITRYRQAQERQRRIDNAKTAIQNGVKYAPELKQQFNNAKQKTGELKYLNKNYNRNVVNGSAVGNSVYNSAGGNSIPTGDINNFNPNTPTTTNTKSFGLTRTSDLFNGDLPTNNGYKNTTQFNGINSASAVQPANSSMTSIGGGIGGGASAIGGAGSSAGSAGSALSSAGSSASSAGSSAGSAGGGMAGGAGAVAGGIMGAANVGMDVKRGDYVSAGLSGAQTIASMFPGIGTAIAMGLELVKRIKSAKDKKNEEALAIGQQEAGKSQALHSNNVADFQNFNNEQSQANNQQLLEDTQQPVENMPVTDTQQQIESQYGGAGYSGTLPDLYTNTPTDIQTPQNDQSTVPQNEQIENLISKYTGQPEEYNGVTGGASSVGAEPVIDNPQPVVNEPIPDTPVEQQDTKVLDGNAQNDNIGFWDRYNQGFNENNTTGIADNSTRSNKFKTGEVETNSNVGKDQKVLDLLNQIGATDEEKYNALTYGRNSGNKKVDEILKQVGLEKSPDGTINYDSKKENTYANKTFANRLGEFAGSANRILSNPAVQGLIAGVGYQIRNKDVAKALEYGANFANNKAKSDAYAKLILGEDYKPSVFGGMYGTDDYKAKTGQDRVENLYYKMLIDKALKERDLDIKQQNADTDQKYKSIKGENDTRRTTGQLNRWASQNKTDSMNAVTKQRKVYNDYKTKLMEIQSNAVKNNSIASKNQAETMEKLRRNGMLYEVKHNKSGVTRYLSKDQMSEYQNDKEYTVTKVNLQ